MTDTEMLDWVDEHECEFEPTISSGNYTACLSYWKDDERFSITGGSARDCIRKAAEQERE